MITSHSDVLAESGYTGAQNQFLTYRMRNPPTTESRIFVLIREGGPRKIKNFTNENSPWVGVQAAHAYYESSARLKSIGRFK